MEENQGTKKRNYERYLEAQETGTSSGDAWTQDPFSQPAYEEPAYQEPVYQEPVYQEQASSYSQPVAPQRFEGLEEPVTKGEWAICYFLMMIPCVGFIMMFVWAFSKTEKKSKSNFFKVQLIFMGVIFALYFLLAILGLAMGIMMG